MTRSVLLLAGWSALVFSAAAQPSRPGNPGPLLPAITNLTLLAPPPARPTTVAAVPAPWGQWVGQTTYDLQTNAAAGHRLTVDNGRVATVWNQRCPAPTGAPATGRHVGYNRTLTAGGAPTDSATTCAGSAGIGTRRAGWPELLRINGQDVVLAHTDSGLVRISRATDAAPWSTSAPLTFSYNIGGAGGRRAQWPRAVASGAVVHLIYLAYDPLSSGTTGEQLLYSRSPDGGLTWDRQNIALPDFDTTHLRNPGGDRYAIAVRGTTVAIAAGSFGDPTLLAISYDGGDTFTTQRLTPPLTDADTVMVNPGPQASIGATVPDGAMALVIDATHAVHWFCGAQFTQVVPGPAPGSWRATSAYYPYALGQLLYWNSRELALLPPQIIADYALTGRPVVPLPNQTRAPYRTTGDVSEPAPVVGAGGEVYCVFSQRMPAPVAGEPGLFHDLYLQKLTFPGGGQVQVHVPRNIPRDLRGLAGGAAARGIESACPSAWPQVENGLLHYQWLSDTIPDFDNAQPGAPLNISAVMLDTLAVGQTVFQPWRLLGGTPAGLSPALDELTAHFAPNPTTGATTLHLTTRRPLTCTLTAYDVLGRLILPPTRHALPAGATTLPLDLLAQPAGVYFITLTADSYRLSRRVLKQ